MASMKVHYGLLDHSAERTRVQLYFEPIAADGSNYASLFDAVTGKVDLVRLALDAITNLNETNVTASIEAHQAVESIPADAMAQREVAIRWLYVDNVTGDKGRFDTPGPVDGIVPTGTDEVNMAAAAVIAFKAVIEANCKSRLGNAITLNSGRLVGRRS